MTEGDTSQVREDEKCNKNTKGEQEVEQSRNESENSNKSNTNRLLDNVSWFLGKDQQPEPGLVDAQTQAQQEEPKVAKQVDQQTQVAYHEQQIVEMQIATQGGVVYLTGLVESQASGQEDGRAPTSHIQLINEHVHRSTQTDGPDQSPLINNPHEANSPCKSVGASLKKITIETSPSRGGGLASHDTGRHDTEAFVQELYARLDCKPPSQSFMTAFGQTDHENQLWTDNELQGSVHGSARVERLHSRLAPTGDRIERRAEYLGRRD